MEISIREEEKIREFLSLFDEEEQTYIARWIIDAFETPHIMPSEDQSVADFIVELYQYLREDCSWNSAPEAIADMKDFVWTEKEYFEARGFDFDSLD